MNDEMIEEFKIEAEEMFVTAEEGFLNIEKGEAFIDNFNKIFRAFHSLKGAAGMFGLQELQAHMHKLESLFEAQKNQAKMDKKKIDYFLSGIDAAKTLLEGRAVNFTHLSNDELTMSDETITPPQKMDAKKEIVHKKTGRGIVYIVDDEAPILEILASMLETMDFEVHTFTSAAALLDSIDIITPDIILSDISMPEMSGIEMVKKIRANSPMVTFIMISGQLSKEMILELLNYDVSGFIEKPFAEEEIKNTVERAFRLSQLSSLLNKSINYMLYQFSDLDSYLKQAGKENVRLALKEELKNIIKIQTEIHEQKKTKK